MTFKIINRTLAGSPFLADYECPDHGRFELLTARGEDGDPPPAAICEGCDKPVPRVIVGTAIAFWTRAVTAIQPAGAFRSDQMDPRALDTRDLAEGKITKVEWRAKQAEITKARRHAKRIKAGRAVRKIQIDSAGVK